MKRLSADSRRLSVFAAALFCGVVSPTNVRAADGESRAVAAVESENDAAERKKFQGVWRVIRTEFGGDAENPVERTADYFYFGDQESASWTKGRRYGSYTDALKIRSETSPRQLDRIKTRARLVGPAIYKWEGEHLIIVIAGEYFPAADPQLIEKKRPKEFKTKKGNQNHFVLTLERIKDGEVEVPKRSPK